MPDDPTPPEIAPYARDERMAELLAVAPLDEVTRRRLVQGALGHAPRRVSRVANIAAIAAAIAIGAGIGALLVNKPDAAPVAQSAGPTEAAAAPADGSSTTAAPAAAAAVNQLGDLGDVSTPAKLRDAVTRPIPTEQYRQLHSAGDAAEAPLNACVTTRPANELGLVAITAAGTGRYQDQNVTVVLGTSPAGEPMAVVLGPSPDCRVLESVVLSEG